jgi:glucose-6-phosphate isomerase
MDTGELRERETWKRLAAHAATFDRPDRHLRHLVQDPRRLERFSATGAGLFLDLSRQRLDETALALLVDLARDRGVLDRMRRMADGAVVNTTEKRAALHMAARDLDGNTTGPSVAANRRDLERVRADCRRFVADVHAGRITGSTGHRFQDVVVVGIGGSYLGTEFVAEALQAHAGKGMRLHFLSNVDIHCFGRIADRIVPEKTLWVVISKSYTTAETMANAAQATAFMRAKGLDPGRHFVAVTAKGSPGDQQDQPLLSVFHMFDYIGGATVSPRPSAGCRWVCCWATRRSNASSKGPQRWTGTSCRRRRKTTCRFCRR